MNTYIKSTVSISITRTILFYIAILGMFVRYLGHPKVWEFILAMLVLYLFVGNRKYKLFFHKNIDIVIELIAIAVLFTFSALEYINPHTTLVNLAASFFPGLIAITLASISVQNNREINRFFSGSFWLFNAFWIANIVVVYLQVTGNHIFIKPEWLAKNSFYPDLCAGLFGFNGTHKLAVFSCFILIYNLVFTKVWNRKKRTVIGIYMVVTEAAMLLLSIRNENLMIYILLPCFFAVYWFFDMYWSDRKLTKKMKRVMIAIALVLGLSMLVFRIPFVREQYLPIITARISRVVFFGSGLYSVSGSNERFAIAQFALSTSKGWFFGHGVGMVEWGEEGSFGFHHYGLNSLGTFINLGGIWYFLIKLLLYSTIAAIFAYDNRKNDKKHYYKYQATCLALYFILTSCTIPFSDMSTTVWIMMIFCVLGQLRHYNVNTSYGME